MCPSWLCFRHCCALRARNLIRARAKTMNNHCCVLAFVCFTSPIASTRSRASETRLQFTPFKYPPLCNGSCKTPLRRPIDRHHRGCLCEVQLTEGTAYPYGVWGSLSATRVSRRILVHRRWGSLEQAADRCQCHLTSSTFAAISFVTLCGGTLCHSAVLIGCTSQKQMPAAAACEWLAQTQPCICTAC